MPKNVTITIDIDEMILEELFDEFGVMDTSIIFKELAENYLATKHSQNQALIDLGNKQNNNIPGKNSRPYQNNRNSGPMNSNRNNTGNQQNSNSSEHPIHAYQRRLNDEEEHKRRALRGGNIGQVKPNTRNNASSAANNRPRGYSSNNRTSNNKMK